MKKQFGRGPKSGGGGKPSRGPKGRSFAPRSFEPRGFDGPQRKPAGSGRGFERNVGRSVMHEAVCSSCGADCEVPFRPTGDKPVLCINCFRKGAQKADRRFEGKSSSVSEGSNSQEILAIKKQLAQINDKLDHILSLLDFDEDEDEEDDEF